MGDEAEDQQAGQGARSPETPEEMKARKEREKDTLYALDISGVEWHSAPGTEQHEERVEIAYLPDGAVAMRSSLEPQTVLRYTEAEWTAFVLGARDGEFDLEPAPQAGGLDAQQGQ
ncbi:DUF397 domain-containing protein [Streptomyces longispororuber]|uniref:DUF397 domain-containing protein n=1 Tax=Streptomyces longispororuber TaxID=68230 RepID=UPI00210EFFE4|nr:DUF397 domain-containing protein [Streptomyces longispororuber]MCQ4212930.1 DUF397 domain-containing protein [Streptomyces longispororuber]